jgi:enoyl-CoA hydratase
MAGGHNWLLFRGVNTVSDFVTYQQDGPVATLTMNDGKANAFSFQMMEELMTGLDRAAKDAEALVIMGKPGVLCAGFDLKVIQGAPAGMKKMAHLGGELLLKIYQQPQPVVIACTGHAVAAGALLLLTGDVRIGVDGEFMIGLNEMELGVPLPTFGVELASDRLDPRHVNAAVLGAQLYGPTEAANVGYLDKVVAPDQLEAEVGAALERIAKLNRSAIAETKKLLRAQTINTIRASLDG